MSKIQIICSSPGMRRHGMVHPASSIYEDGVFSEKQLDAFRADPAFTVLKVAEGGVQVEGGDIEAAVAARVGVVEANLEAEFEAAKAKLQADFARTVKDAVAEKIDAARAEAVKGVQTQLAEANGKITVLTAALEEAKTKGAPKK